MKRVIGDCLAVSLVAALVMGCGQASNLLPASGTITYNGKPLEGAVVTFLGEGNKLGSGTTDAAGKYTISTDGKPGATPGKNQVVVSKTTGASVPQAATGQAATGQSKVPSPEEIQKMQADMMKGMKGKQAQNLLPPKYANPNESGFTADVQAGKSTFDFTLSD